MLSKLLLLRTLVTYNYHLAVELDGCDLHPRMYGDEAVVINCKRLIPISMHLPGLDDKTCMMHKLCNSTSLAQHRSISQACRA